VTLAQIRAIDYYVPEAVLDNKELASLYSGWSPESIENKLGIHSRRIAAPDETATDMAVKAGEKLLARGVCQADEIDFIILCTQSPDHFLPTSSCLIQQRLGIPTTCGAFDFNLGCSGYVYGLSIAKGLIETGQAKRILLLTSETYSKYIHDLDRATRPLFGDAAAATLITPASEIIEAESDESLIGPFVFGTDGAGADLLVVPAGAHRTPVSPETSIEKTGVGGGVRTDENLYMNGPAIFSFSLETVPLAVNALLEKSGLEKTDIDQFVFHQANKFMLDRLRRECDIDPDRFIIEMAEVANTVSSTIPIALVETQKKGNLKPGSRLMLVGFGVGLSWGAVIVKIPEAI
jgi:3-oxoacyl-[acyl-carrier-protein] synthase III